jgi:hypothetical protein
VVAADASLELLEFSRARALSEGISSIEYVHIDPLYKLNLPFKEKVFDVIVLNGVLEWAAFGSDAADPHDLQQRLLTYLNTFLREDGVLCIGIENRLFPGWLSRDPHSKLKWTSILPRPIADAYVQRKGFGKGYQTYIYSSCGYKRMLERAGFETSKFYYPYTSYRDPTYIYSNDWPIRKFLFNGYLKQIFTGKWVSFLRMLSVVRLDRTFLSSFIIFATKDTQKDMTPFLIRSAIEQNVPSVRRGDSIMKVKDIGETGSSAHFLIFHEDSQVPYATIVVTRNPTSSDTFRIYSKLY